MDFGTVYYELEKRKNAILNVQEALREFAKLEGVDLADLAIFGGTAPAPVIVTPERTSDRRVPPAHSTSGTEKSSKLGAKKKIYAKPRTNGNGPTPKIRKFLATMPHDTVFSVDEMKKWTGEKKYIIGVTLPYMVKMGELENVGRGRYRQAQKPIISISDGIAQAVAAEPLPEA